MQALIHTENLKSKKYIFNFQKAISMGAGFDTNSIYHRDVFVDGNGNIIANKTGVYKPEYSLSSYDMSNSNTPVIDQM